jgi:hypothetical protein
LAGALCSISTVAVIPAERMNVGRHLIEVDSNRDPLGKTHPGEDRIDRCDTLIVGPRVASPLKRRMNAPRSIVARMQGLIDSPHAFSTGRIPVTSGICW